MPFHDPHEAELQLDTYIRRGQWSQAVETIDAWLAKEPRRTELFLRKAQVFRALGRHEQGLAAVRAYRTAQDVDAGDAVFLEVDFLLALGRTNDAMQVIDQLDGETRASAQGEFYRGRVLVARNDLLSGLRALWAAHEHEPGFHRALLEWTAAAMRYYGKRRVRRQLEALLAQRANDPSVEISVGLALTVLDDRHARSILRNAVERYPVQSRPARLPDMAVRGDSAAVRDPYRVINEKICTGHYRQALDVYYQVVEDDPTWLTVLAPFVAEVLVDEVARPEEARVLLEDALRRDTLNHRLHFSYTKVFLQLGFGEEALSSANCALELAPESEKPIARLQRACACVLLNLDDRAVIDLMSAVGQMPELRERLSTVKGLRPLAHDARFRALAGGDQQVAPPSRWERVRLWLYGR